MSSVNGFKLTKTDGETYIFVWHDTGENLKSVLRTFGRFAAHPELSFNWYDAAALSLKVRRMKHRYTGCVVSAGLPIHECEYDADVTATEHVTFRLTYQIDPGEPAECCPVILCRCEVQGYSIEVPDEEFDRYVDAEAFEIPKYLKACWIDWFWGHYAANRDEVDQYCCECLPPRR